MLFHINRDAYKKLSDYLSAVENQFSKKESKEILQEIETRLAELFSEKISAQKQVIVLKDVEEAIEIIGNPEDFTDNRQSSNSKTHTRATRRLYRDPDNKILGGVCSGLGAYFSADPVLIRFIFILFTILFASGVLIYLILWVVTPEAITMSQKREMRGETFNFNHFKRNAKDEYEDLKNNFNL